MTERLKIARALAARPKIKAIIFQTTLASRSLAERIEALTTWLAAEPLPKPLSSASPPAMPPRAK